MFDMEYLWKNKGNLKFLKEGTFKKFDKPEERALVRAIEKNSPDFNHVYVGWKNIFKKIDKFLKKVDF